MPKETFILKLKSNPENVSKVEPFVKKVSEKVKLDEVQFHKVLVSVTEAVNNAILHGNKSDPEKSVTVKCKITRDYLLIGIKDEGEGFDPDKLPNPLDQERLLEETGRGVFLMKTLMDEVEFNFNKTGTEVLLAHYTGPKRGILQS